MEDETLSTGELTERQDYSGRHDRGGEPSAEPDVLLDVPQLRVEEIILEVEDLRAHVSVQADVLNLLKLSVGADVQLGGVHLEIKGVEAQALLKVRLDKVAEIINRVLTTIDRNPEIVDKVVVGPVDAAAGELEGTVEGSVDEVTGALENAAPDLDRSVAEMIEDPSESAAIAEEPADAEPQHETEAAGPKKGAPGGLRRRRRHEPSAEQAPP
jgi:hypothetical protein